MPHIRFSQASLPFLVKSVSFAAGSLALKPIVGRTLISLRQLSTLPSALKFFRNPSMKWCMSVVECDGFFVVPFSFWEGSGRFNSYIFLYTASLFLSLAKSECRIIVLSRLISYKIIAPTFGSTLDSRSKSRFITSLEPWSSTILLQISKNLFGISCCDRYWYFSFSFIPLRYALNKQNSSISKNCVVLN